MNKLYKGLLALLLIGMVSQTKAQQNIGIGTVQPDKSAVLDIQSADKGLLIPRMTVDQRNAINNPANGLMVYQTNEDSGFYFFDGLQWSPLVGNEAKSVSTLDKNGWSLDGNAVTDGNKNAATSASFIGTPDGVPINFKIGGVAAGKVDNSNNLYFGYRSGLTNNGAGNNSGFGSNTLTTLTTGYNNSAFGSNALEKTTSGANNLAIGGFALQNTTEGGGNIALGHATLITNSLGNSNVAIGADALFSATGSQNIAIGRSALVNLGSTNNNIAIGFQAGNSNVSGGNNVFLGTQAGYSETESNKLYIANSSTTTPLIYGNFSAKFVSIGDVEVGKREAANTSGGYKLIVEGGILTEKVKVALKSSGDWADYVFEPEYKANMMSLEEIERFTIANKHLPNVPASEEMVSSGLDVAETSKMFMEKIEELTLYMIELNKEVKALKVENEVLKSKIK